MRNVMMFVFGVMLHFAPASAAGLELTLTNMSSDQIVEITARPVTVESEAEAGAQNLIPAPIAVAAKTDITMEAEDGVCVFDLQFTFASGQIQSRPDTDLCQTDQIIVE